MKKGKGTSFIAAGLTAFLWVAVSCKSPVPRELKVYPLDSLEGLITARGMEFDPAESADGKGSLKITASAPVTVRLFETGDLDVENARLTYQAKVKTEGLTGKAYLEMWCALTGKGEFFSRGLYNPVSGSVNWTTIETPFFLKKGENPANIALHLVIEGTGTVWIDDIRLIAGPLK